MKSAGDERTVMTKPLIPIVLAAPAGYARLCAEGHRLLSQSGLSIVENPHDRPLTKSELLEQVGAVSAAVVGVEPWDEDVFAAAPRLKVICKQGVGVDNIDLAAAQRHGVYVTNAPGGNSNAVAELTLGLVLALLRRIPQMHQACERGDWTRLVGQELTGRTVGLVGFGSIAQLVARRFSGFDVRLVAYDPFLNAEAAARLQVAAVDGIEQLLAESDIVSLHVPARPDGRPVLDAAAIALLKPGSILVNTARGSLVDYDALAARLNKGELAGAALDVFPVEPIPPDSPLLRLPNVVLSNHAGAESQQAYDAISVTNANAILDALSGKAPANALTHPHIGGK